jgi:hypothetical protein
MSAGKAAEKSAPSEEEEPSVVHAEENEGDHQLQELADAISSFV